MSPRLDMPLNRREALTAVLTMLAFVMGAGAVPEATEAADLPLEMDGAFLGDVNGEQWAGEFRLIAGRISMEPFDR